jgi:DNA repair exonuclease SbcCD ATPase subunit
VIQFRQISFCNLLSVGNQPVTIKLNTHRTTLIHGTNGSGKSLILDALCYVLFNKSFRGVNLPSLVNTSNKKGLLVEVEFSIGKTQYMVVRGMKPKVFKIYRDGNELDQQASDRDNQAYLEKNILKMNQKTFMQVVILGSGNYEPFMAMNAASRRECVEDLLDIKIFTTMAVLAKEKLASLKSNLSTIKGDISREEYNIEIQEERVKDIESRSEDDIKELDKQVEELKTKQVSLANQIADLTTHSTEVDSDIAELLKKDPDKKHKEYTNVTIGMNQKIKTLTENITFYFDNENCHTCGQHINEELKEQNIQKYEAEKQKLEEANQQASKVIDQLNGKLLNIQQKRNYKQDVDREIMKLNLLRETTNRNIQDKVSSIIKLKDDTSMVDKEKQLLSKYHSTLVELTQKKDDMVTELNELEMVVSMLKESGIKAQIVKNYLPVMNKLIRKYLGDLEFPIHFRLDSEFKESVASPYHQDFVYESFSEGQKGRIDIALLLTWREIGKLKNSVSTNMLFLDEVFSSSLDEVGKECLFGLIRYGMKDTNSFVIDHTLSNTYKDRFDESIEVKMERGFSQYSPTKNVL